MEACHHGEQRTGAGTAPGKEAVRSSDGGAWRWCLAAVALQVVAVQEGRARRRGNRARREARHGSSAPGGGGRARRRWRRSSLDEEEERRGRDWGLAWLLETEGMADGRRRSRFEATRFGIWGEEGGESADLGSAGEKISVGDPGSICGFCCYESDEERAGSDTFVRTRWIRRNGSKN